MVRWIAYSTRSASTIAMTNCTAQGSDDTICWMSRLIAQEKNVGANIVAAKAYIPISRWFSRKYRESCHQSGRRIACSRICGHIFSRKMKSIADSIRSRMNQSRPI